jgi:hypothetical protein
MKFPLTAVFAPTFMASLDQVLSHVLVKEDEASANNLQQRQIKGESVMHAKLVVALKII